ncbi:shikimate kinase [Campylobacter sp. 9BO]|uniref:shikimate kinase n=1 Tax=Campylobacter sp. 9BO TaxID=3424759 RepID=UPI003D358EF1
MKSSHNIVLIGFMGAGKGSVARELAQNLDRFNVDTDDMIENSLNMKIREIFSEFGETHFRALEKNLAKFLAKNLKNAIISTGGGFAMVKGLNKIGKVIYLKASFDCIIERMRNSENAEKKFAKRPLLNDLDKARELHKSREKIYEKKADIIINVENKTIKQIAKEIKKILNKEKD